MWMDLCILESFIRYSPVTIKHIIDSTRALLNPAKAGYSSDLEKDVLAYTITLHCLDWSRSSLLGVGDCYCWVETLKWRPSNHYALICLVPSYVLWEEEHLRQVQALCFMTTGQQNFCCSHLSPIWSNGVVPLDILAFLQGSSVFSKHPPRQ